tara:strand:+ start:19431 stop:20756 length:1326 start_codon:yes stop_codon:yes gene_type:complete
MCGIIISNLNIPKSAFKYIENRGPDNTNIVKYKEITFIHFLLHLTGSKTLQPLIDETENIVIIFNGEIYNYKEILNDAKSDIYSIMYLYKKYGLDFTKYLDGEFTIVIFDFKQNLLLLLSDIFKTKPLFYNINNNNIVISSYESTCNEIKINNYHSIKPNELLVYNLNDRTLIEKRKIYEFDLNQYKKNYDDYIKAFEKSVLKRYPEDSIPLVTLSSGLDSGSIACCLNKYNKKSYYYSIPKNESINTLIERNKILKNNHKFIDLNNEDKVKWKNYLDNNCEKFNWDWKYNPNTNTIDNGFNQGSMLGKSKIINDIKKIDTNVRVLFSGIGADEVMARNQYYSRGYGNVNEFTENLKELFPWPNFFNGSMENYLKGDEYVGGCFSFETRYPFCDRDLVQEFMWLSPELKNIYKGSIYKPPLLYYLDINNFPLFNKKLGFNV